MLYKALGFAVWKGAKWYVGRRVSSRVPSKALVAGGLVALGIGAAAVLAKRSTEG